MAKSNLQNNKFRPATLPEVCAPRKHLTGQLDQALSCKLAVISAPAGFGKTVSALLWLRGSGRQTVWIGLDAFDNMPSVFYQLFCTGILSAQPDNERMASILRSDAFISSPMEHTIHLLSEFWQDDREYALVLDDLHTVTHDEITRSLPSILRRLPHAFATLLLTRSEPDEAYIELSQTGGAAVLTAQELSFSADEIREHFASFGHFLTEEEAKAAHAFTGGWAIGVNALLQSGEKAPSTSGGQILERYIKKQIWDKWDEDLRSFILQTAAVSEMPIALCETLTGRQDAAEILNKLYAANAFVSRGQDGIYRYHHLFLDFVRALPEYGGNTSLYQAATKYYLEQGEHIAARRYAYQSGDIDLIASTQYSFSVNSGFSIDRYLSATDDLFLAPLPEDLLDKRPVIYIQYAFMAFLRGDNKVFERYSDKLWLHIPTVVSKYPQFWETAFMTIVLDYRTPLRKLIKWASTLPRMSFEDENLRAATMSFQMPFLHRSCRDFYELTDKKLYKIFKSIFGKLLKRHDNMIMHCVDAGLYLEQNRLTDALVAAHEAASALNEHIVREMRFAAYMQLAAVHYALGQDRELKALLSETELFIEEQAGFLRPNFFAFTARLSLWNGDRSAAREWLERYFVTTGRKLEPYRLYQYFTTARAYIVLGELNKAESYLTHLRRLTTDFQRLIDHAEAGILLSIVLWVQDNKEEALNLLEEVLLTLQPYGFIRVVADEGAAVLPALKKLLAKVERSGEKSELDRVYVNNVYLAAYAESKRHEGVTAHLDTKPIKLSKQQKMMIELLAQGYRNADIMEKTGLTINTVKAHTRLAYEKLGVSTAADAVIRARELGLIE